MKAVSAQKLYKKQLPPPVGWLGWAGWLVGWAGLGCLVGWAGLAKGKVIGFDSDSYWDTYS